jgi:uncharacterized membrane protein YdbT with pleckstrin-like domain
MAFPRKLLIEGEELILDLRPHWIALAGPVLAAILVIAGWIVASNKLDGVAVWVAFAAGVLILLIYALPKVIAWATSHFVVTSDRIIHRQGFIAKSSMEVPLEALNDVRFQQSILERMIGAGDLILESAGEQGRQVFSHIRGPEEVQKTIYQQGEHNQQRMRGVGQGVPASPSATTELERLADLRARGVLTEEEFQAQKRKILGS